MTIAMMKTLLLSETETVFTGANVRGGAIVARVSASTLKALERRHLVRISTSPDGGLMASITIEGRSLLDTMRKQQP